MRIGILGSGDVGRKLADSFIENKHIVKIGSRNPNQERAISWASWMGDKCAYGILT